MQFRAAHVLPCALITCRILLSSGNAETLKSTRTSKFHCNSNSCILEVSLSKEEVFRGNDCIQSVSIKELFNQFAESSGRA
ncbi:hypothetical protein P3L10_029714 [Capsicum annuum]